MALPIEDLQDLARKKAVAAGIPVEPFLRQIGIESAWNPDAVGPPTRIIDPQTGERQRARGLGQFMPGTAKQYGLTNPFDPDANLTASANYMADLLKLAKGDYGVAATMYNFGPGNVLAGKPLPPETQNYRAQIMGGNPAPRGELRAARPEGLREALYNKFFSSLNTGLPAAKAWVGEELPEQTEPTLMDLLGGGMTAASLMGGGMPALALEAPAAFGMGPGRLAASMAQSLGFGKFGGAIGEEVAGQEGRDIGETIGSNIGFSKLPSPLASHISGIPIPPIGPLEGTKVLTPEGLAKVVYHGSPVDFPEYDPQFFQRGRFGLKGVWSTTQPQEASQAYAGVSPSESQKLIKNKTQEYRSALKQQGKFAQDSFENKLSRHYSPDQIAQIRKAYSAFDPDNADNIGGLSNRFIENISGSEENYQKYLQEGKDPFHYSRSDIPHNVEERALLLYNLRNSKIPGQRLRKEINELKGGSEVSAATNSGSNPHLRPQYLAVKNPFNLDKPAGPEEIGPIKAQLWEIIQRMGPKQPAASSKHPVDKWGRAVIDLYNDLHFGDKTGQPNSELFRNIRHALGDSRGQQLIEDAGFDGFTHIGTESHHRVYINDPSKVIPAFDPRLVDVQSAQARKMALARELRALKAENEQLRRKAGALVEDDDPRHFADLPFDTKQKQFDARLREHIRDGQPYNLRPGELPHFYEQDRGLHPMLGKFMSGVEKAYLKYHETGELTPLIHLNNSAGVATSYPDMVRSLVSGIREAKKSGNPISHRQIIDAIDQNLTPAARQEWKNGKFDWRKDIAR